MNNTINFKFISDENLIQKLVDIEKRVIEDDLKPLPNLIRQVLEYSLKPMIATDMNLNGMIYEWKNQTPRPPKQAVKAAEFINVFGNDGSHSNDTHQMLTSSSMMNNLWCVLLCIHGYDMNKKINTKFINYNDSKKIREIKKQEIETSQSLQKDAIESYFGKPYDSLYFGGISRDNNMFGEINKWNNAGYDSFMIEHNNDDKYRFMFHKGNVQIPGKWNKIKSFGSVLYDLAFLDKKFCSFLGMRSGSKDNNIVDINLGNKFELSKALRFYNELVTKENHLKDHEVWSYWREIDSKYNKREYFDTIIPKMMTSIYLLHREISNNRIDEAEVMIKKTNRIASVETIIRINSSIFVNWEYHYESLDLEKINRDIKTDSKEILTDRYTIGEIFKSIQNGKIKIPVFQRDYVWSDSQIVELINSIKLNYPIGSLLFASTSQNFKSKNIIVDSISSDNYEVNKILLLDGQQRLSSIILIVAFVNIRNYMLQRVKSKNSWLKKRLEEIKEKIIIDTSRSGKDQKIAFLKKDYIETLNEEGKDSSKINWEKFQLDKNAKSVFELIKKYPISTITINGTDTDRMIEIFRRINIGSRKLTHIDLMNAGFNSQNEEFGFLDEISDILNSDDHIKNFKYKPEHIVHIWKLLYDFETSSDGFSSKNKKLTELAFDSASADCWINLTGKIEPLIKKITNYLKNTFGFHNTDMVPNDAFIIMTAAMMIFNKRIDDENIWQHVIKRTLLKDYASGTMGKVTNDINHFFFNNHDLEFNLKIDGEWSKRIMFEIKESSYDKKKSAMYKILIGLLSLQKPVSLIDGEELVFSNYDLWTTSKNDQHHFLPLKVKNFKDISSETRNSFANITLIKETENRVKIKNNSPFQYLLKDVDEGDEGINKKLAKISDTHLFDEDILSKIYHGSDSIELMNDLFQKRIEKIFIIFQEKFNITE